MYTLLLNFLVIASTKVVILITQVAGENAGDAGTSGSDFDNMLQGSYDFVIVGGGTSGCVLANRLSESFTVLVLQEGGLPPEDFDIPAKMGAAYSTSPDIKHYFTVPQQNAGLDSNNGRMAYLIGKALGGGSQVNGMGFNRGSPHDYNNWANLTGDPSWKYENLMKFFKKIEDYHGRFPENEDQHRKGGPITISESKYVPGFEALMKAGEFYGFPSRKDPNGPQIPSFAPFEWSQRAGRRVSSYKGYIKPILETRPKLKILLEAKVHRVIFDSSKKRAIGVTFMSNSQRNGGANISDDSTVLRFVGANKEVIISAGVIDSPTILMRSGIGPLDVLESSNIPAVKILPVGHNLHDHLLLRVDFMINRDTPAGVFLPEIDLNPETWKLYEETGDGPYSCLAGINGQIFWVSGVRSKEVWPNPEWADVHLIHSQVAKNVHPEDKLVNIYTRPFLSRPKSRGRVTLNSSDVDAMPLIDFKFLSDPEGHDMQIFLEALNFTINVYENAPSFKEQGCRLKDTQDVNCDGGNLVFRSDEYWKCVIRHKSGGGLHGGGTCRMGRGNGDDPEAVVDTRLRVIGVEGLRVVDLSVAPQVTNTNTQPVAYVVAEKAADMIKEDWIDECRKTMIMNGGSSEGEMSHCF